MSAYMPSPKDAEKVKACVRAGVVDPERIARIVGISVAALTENYPYELGYTDDEDLAVVVDVAYNMATCGKFPHMTQWWLKCKGGHMWQEKPTNENLTVAPIIVMIKGDGNNGSLPPPLVPLIPG